MSSIRTCLKHRGMNPLASSSLFLKSDTISSVHVKFMPTSGFDKDAFTAGLEHEKSKQSRTVDYQPLVRK